MAPWINELRRRLGGGRELGLLLSAAVFCVALWGFLELAEDVPEGRYQTMDEHILRSLRQPGDPARPIGPGWLNEASRDVSALGSATILGIMTVAVVGYLLLARLPRPALLVIIAVTGGEILNEWLKYLSARPRPEIVPHLTAATSSSFPSGHSMLSAIVYLTLGTLLARTVTGRGVKVFFISVALFLSFIVGLSRVYLGVHYPTDVLAGWAAGTAWAILCWAVASWVEHKRTLQRLIARPSSDR